MDYRKCKKIFEKKLKKVLTYSYEYGRIYLSQERKGMIIMVKTIYYTIENGIKNLEWIARNIETKEVVKEFEDMQQALRFVNENENTELFDRTTKQVFEFLRR